jgi:hypothetical protein
MRGGKRDGAVLFGKCRTNRAQRSPVILGKHAAIKAKNCAEIKSESRGPYAAKSPKNSQCLPQPEVGAQNAAPNQILRASVAESESWGECLISSDSLLLGAWIALVFTALLWVGSLIGSEHFDRFVKETRCSWTGLRRSL